MYLSSTLAQSAPTNLQIRSTAKKTSHSKNREHTSAERMKSRLKGRARARTWESALGFVLVRNFGAASADEIRVVITSLRSEFRFVSRAYTHAHAVGNPV